MTSDLIPVQFWQKGNTAYFITPDGRVLSAPQDDAPAGLPSGRCREIASFNGKGYRRVRIQGKNFKVHRLVAEAFVPNPSHFPHVLHLDGNRTNNHFSNLVWSASQSNHL